MFIFAHISKKRFTIIDESPREFDSWIIGKYKKEKEAKTVLIPFHADIQLDYDKQVFYRGGYLFLQSIKAMNFAKIQEQGFIPLYKREAITDALHEVSGFRTKKINRKYLRLILCIF